MFGEGVNMANRFYIYPKDLMRLTGQSERACQELHKTVLAAFKRKKFVSVADWARYNGNTVDEIKKELNIR